MALVLLVSAPARFCDEELFETQAELMQAGQQTVIANTKTGFCPGSRGGQATAELILTEVNCADYAAVVFVGGGGSKLLFHDPEAWRIARTRAQQNQVVAAICLAPVILAQAGVLQGRQATVAGTAAVTIETLEARYTGPGVTIDGNLVTANGPKSSRQFGRAIAQVLAGRVVAEEIWPVFCGGGRGGGHGSPLWAACVVWPVWGLGLGLTLLPPDAAAAAVVSSGESRTLRRR